MNKSKSFSFITNILKLKDINYVVDDEEGIIRAQGSKKVLSVLHRIGLVTSTSSSKYFIGVKPPIYISMNVDSGQSGDELAIFDYSEIVNEIKDMLAARNIAFTEKYEGLKIVLHLAEPQTLKQLDAYIRSCEGVTAIRKLPNRPNRPSTLKYTHSSGATIHVAPQSIIIY